MPGLIQDSVSTLSELVQLVKGQQRRAISSLTKFTKDANIIGRVYIEENIAKDDVAVPLMGMLNQMYISYILTALHLDQVVAGGRTVRQVIGTVASEGYTDAAKIIETCFGKDGLDKPMPSMEDALAKIEDESQRLVCGRLIELDMMGQYSVSNTDTTTKSEKEIENGKVDANGNILSRKDLVLTKQETSGDYGKTPKETKGTFERSKINGKSSTETKIKNEDKLQPFKAYIYVQLIPYILDSGVTSNFFDFNFVPGFLRRWRQLRTGEIKFFRDFIFAKDLVEKQKTAIKKDKSGILVDMLFRQRNALMRWASQLAGLSPENHNAASSMCVISKQTFDIACASAHVDFTSFGQRERFFTKTFTMLVVVVDPMYGSVDMYINGINVKGNYTFDMINKVGTKGKDSFDLKQIMQALNQGMTPKF